MREVNSALPSALEAEIPLCEQEKDNTRFSPLSQDSLFSLPFPCFFQKVFPRIKRPIEGKGKFPRAFFSSSFPFFPCLFFPPGFRKLKKGHHPALRKKISAEGKMCFFICMRFLLSLAVSHFLPPSCFAVHPSSQCHKYFKVIEMQRKTHPRKGVQLRRIRGDDVNRETGKREASDQRLLSFLKLDSEFFWSALAVATSKGPSTMTVRSSSSRINLGSKFL